MQYNTKRKNVNCVVKIVESIHIGINKAIQIPIDKNENLRFNE